jgi:energy-coupling factor transport system permease protein
MKRQRRPRSQLVETSPLRQVDPRAKLYLSLCASLAVMLPLQRLALFMIVYAGLLLWARLLPRAAHQVWRLKWILTALFVVDWIFVSAALGAVITLRLILLAGAFTLLFATTTAVELRLALEWLGLPYRYAFSFSLAFQSVELLDTEWRSILEAQQARGAWSPPEHWRELPNQLKNMIALTVPAVVLTAKRAWATTETAYARGFDSPRRRSYHKLTFTRKDWGLVIMGTLVTGAFLLL